MSDMMSNAWARRLLRSICMVLGIGLLIILGGIAGGMLLGKVWPAHAHNVVGRIPEGVMIGLALGVPWTVAMVKLKASRLPMVCLGLLAMSFLLGVGGALLSI